VKLLRGFENAAVIVKQMSDSEVRVRTAASTNELRFLEEAATPLSNRDRGALLALLDDPPKPNDFLKAAADRAKKAAPKVTE
jgi:uncharacterized protein (DUF1778 family)